MLENLFFIHFDVGYGIGWLLSESQDRNYRYTFKILDDISNTYTNKTLKLLPKDVISISNLPAGILKDYCDEFIKKYTRKDKLKLL